MVRLTTVQTLLALYTSPPSERLSQRLSRSLSADPLYPVLTDAQLQAIDRRLGLVLQHVDLCLQRTSHDDVLIDDPL